MISIKHTAGEIVIQGHAGYAPRGEDIVCAAISTLTQVLITSVEELTEDLIKYDIKAGRASISYGNLSEQAQLLVDSFFIGCRMVAEAHPENVRIEK